MYELWVTPYASDTPGARTVASAMAAVAWMHAAMTGIGCTVRVALCLGPTS